MVGACGADRRGGARLFRKRACNRCAVRLRRRVFGRMAAHPALISNVLYKTPEEKLRFSSGVIALSSFIPALRGNAYSPGDGP